MPVSLNRLQERLDALANIGKDSQNGITRLAYSEQDLKARSLLISWGIDLGLEVKVDQIGNIFIKRQGEEAGPKLMLGSHLDTVTNGGPFDGPLGVIGALEVLNAFAEENLTTKYPVELVVFACEESSRFGCSLVGSKYLTGGLAPEKLQKFKDKDGISIHEALKQAKLIIQEENTSEVTFSADEVLGFIELHIEQSDTLFKENLPIGIVKNIAAPTRLKIILEGQASHSGATPMEARADALTAAAEVILLVEELGCKEANYETVATATTLDIKPNNMNVIPGLVEMGVDIRGVDKASISRVLTCLEQGLKEIAAKRVGIKIEQIILSKEDPVALDLNYMNQAQKVCELLSIPYKLMNSAAGHDCMSMAKVVPAGLVFIRNVSGVSHNPAEWVAPEDTYTGIQVLYQMAKNIAMGNMGG